MNLINASGQDNVLLTAGVFSLLLLSITVMFVGLVFILTGIINIVYPTIDNPFAFSFILVILLFLFFTGFFYNYYKYEFFTKSLF